jgi:diacylglycerol kinase family enzyme
MPPPPSRAPQIAPDAVLSVVVNAGSGHDDAGDATAVVRGILEAAGRRHAIHRIDGASAHGDVVSAAAREAAANHGVLVAAGGDGTVNSAAAAALAHDVAFGVLPRGTFNLFARAHGVPQDVGDATRALLRGRVQPVQVGRVGGRPFLVNAALGLYPQVLEDRERFKAEHGRSRANAIVSGLRSLLREPVQRRLDIDTGDGSRSVRTPTLFVGNNPLQLARLGIDAVPGGGLLTGIVVRPIATAAMFRLALRGALGTLGDDDNVESFRFRRLTVALRGQRRTKVAIDGEVAWLDAPLAFDVWPSPLWLLAPAPEDRGPVA